jgi:hypothetical protein
MATYTAMSESDLARIDFRHWWGGNGQLAFNLAQAHAGMISSPMLEDASDCGASLYDLISHPHFHALVSGAFANRLFRPSTVTNCRLIAAASHCIAISATIRKAALP